MPGVTGVKTRSAIVTLLWIASRATARFRRVKHRRHTYAFSITNTPFIMKIDTLRAASPLASLLLQPSANPDPPSGWLVLSTFIELPIALWAYEVCLVEQFRDYHIVRWKTPCVCADAVLDAGCVSTESDIHG